MKEENADLDAAILIARDSVTAMVERLIEIAKTDPPTHVSVKAAEAVIRLSGEQTKRGLFPFGDFEF